MTSATRRRGSPHGAVRFVAFCALALVAPTFARASAANVATCSSSSLGGHIVLQSDAVDPEVFVWDSRDRMVEYAEGHWGTTRAVFSHTLLAEPGTQAAVVACIPGVAHPRFSTGDQDAIGVRILTGSYRGKYGWVLSGDTHAVRSSRDAQSVASPPPRSSEVHY